MARAGIRRPSLFGSGGGPLLRLAVPAVGQLEALCKAGLRLVAEIPSSFGNVRLGVADVAFARRIVCRLERLSGNFPQRGEDLVERDADAAAHVEKFAGRVGGFAGEQVGVDGVIHERKIAGLSAVAKNDRRSILEKRDRKSTRLNSSH